MFPISEHYKFEEIFDDPKANLPEVDELDSFKFEQNKFWYHGMYVLIDNCWVETLAKWLSGNNENGNIARFYEVMAGRGWLAKALEISGIQIDASDSGDDYTDRKSLDLPENITNAVFHVENQRALEVADEIIEYVHGNPGSRVAVIICYPPETSSAYDFIKRLPEKTFIIYIGDEDFIFTANKEFKNSITWLHQNSNHPDNSLLEGFPKEFNIEGVHANHNNFEDVVIWLGVV
ncbi:hypothetical protein [Paenibacillus silvae]|uniref:hypothetical protein n=1 Tax=Paenibacillus silvae TaxID=1325358 RepID=UPI002002EC81|nr:hypothetical protein [Paenibacillus silvae]MCK6075397.1 hypothetical protein [Paenibacillus silvae]MCK6149784.1 hypothetical protein [Paenibacillus silvae]MCK6268082.1 hypothetical protein [Paenibacillus silvae]